MNKRRAECHIAQKRPASSLSNHQEADAAFDVVTTPTLVKSFMVLKGYGFQRLIWPSKPDSWLILQTEFPKCFLGHQ